MITTPFDKNHRAVSDQIDVIRSDMRFISKSDPRYAEYESVLEKALEVKRTSEFHSFYFICALIVVFLLINIVLR